ncbi:MAG: TrbG/VirB9 family P-type conjugative transfer protein, partial [Hydrogenophaga sp.]|nr:TrbG/VirB9 family P-type conjugative transfer protein [Hydrogenophaga sp.]
MKRTVFPLLVTCSLATSLFAQTNPKSADPRLRDVVYDPAAVVTVPVKRGMVTLVVLAQDEVITEVAAGQGGDCSKADAVWCVAAQPGGRNLFVKAKSGAEAPNNL